MPLIASLLLPCSYTIKSKVINKIQTSSNWVSCPSWAVEAEFKQMFSLPGSHRASTFIQKVVETLIFHKEYPTFLWKAKKNWLGVRPNFRRVWNVREAAKLFEKSWWILQRHLSTKHNFELTVGWRKTGYGYLRQTYLSSGEIVARIWPQKRTAYVV